MSWRRRDWRCEEWGDDSMLCVISTSGRLVKKILSGQAGFFERMVSRNFFKAAMILHSSRASTHRMVVLSLSRKAASAGRMMRKSYYWLSVISSTRGVVSDSRLFASASPNRGYLAAKVFASDGMMWRTLLRSWTLIEQKKLPPRRPRLMSW